MTTLKETSPIVTKETTVGVKPSLFSRKNILEFLRLSTLQIVLTLLLLTFLIPIFWMFSSSLKASTEIFVVPVTWIPESPRWSNFSEIFSEDFSLPFATFIWNSITVVFWAVLGTVLSSAMVAYAFSRLEWPGRDFFFGLLVATILIPPIVTLIPRFIEFRNFGWLNTHLPLTVPYWFAGTPLYVFIMRQFFRTIPKELDEAAYMDGAGHLRILFQIILPLSKPVIATVAVFSLLQHYNDYLSPLIFINSVEKWTLPVGLASLNATESFVYTWETIFAASTIAVTPVIILFVFAQRYFVQGISMSGFGGR
ncbi:MAG: multiple sugar transport system permease protein [Cellvibrionaceae bacterium]|jgi:multiple sugar transport system permease protein